MHNPQKRIPPPPSAPPPKNITRSGRIPRPKGAPPGGAKLANASRNYEWHADQRNRNGDAENEDTLRRRESISVDEESTCDGLGCDSSWSSSSSERNALPSSASFGGGGSMTRSDLDTSPSNGSHGSRWRCDKERRDRRIGYNDGKELRESPNGWSSDTDQEAANFGTRPRDDVSEEEWDRTRNQGYLRSHRRWSGPARVSNTDREGRHRTDDRHGKHKERSRRQDKERIVVKKNNCVEDTRELDGSESPFHYLAEERQRSSDPGSHDSDLRSSSRRQGSSERQRLNNRLRRDSGYNNGAEKQLGCSRNRKSDTGNNRSGEYKKSRQSDKDSPYAEENGITRGQDRARSCARIEGGPAGKAEHSPAAGIPGDKSPASISGNDTGSSGTEKRARNPSMGGSTPVGKPVRGARWGEAIGVRSKVFDTATIPTGRAEVRGFICSPLRSGPGTVLRCFIERSRGGPHKLSRVYSMYADLEDGSGRLLLAARKLLASKTAYYIICTRQDDLFRESGRRGGSSFLGKLRATSSSHTEYALYDSGQNPALVDTAIVGGDFTSNRRERESKTSASFEHSLEGEEGHEELRRELGVIVYKFDKKEQRTGKRRMEVAIPQVRRRGDAWEQVSWQPRHIKEGMKLSFGRIRYQGGQNLLQDHRMVVFHQRESRYDPLSSCLVDFKGRATAPSVKNFQLLKSPPEDNAKREQYYSEGAGKDEGESDDLPRPVYLQMGKVGRDCFNVDVEWPLSLLQAFAVCLSRFDTNARF